jgi:hypothetical protein
MASFMDAMPHAIYGGSQGWEFIKEKEEVVKYAPGRFDEPRHVMEWKYRARTPEARKALKAVLAGYKVLWNAAKRDPEVFHDLIKQFNSDDIIVPCAEESNYETLGIVGEFERNPKRTAGSCLDRYDFGSYAYED